MTGETDLYIKRALLCLPNIDSVDVFDYRGIYAASCSLLYVNTVLYKKVKTQKPELLLIVKGELIEPHIIKVIREHCPNVVIVLWHFDPVDANAEWIKDRAKACTHFFTSCGACVPIYQILGINVFWLSEGCDPVFHQPMELTEFEQHYYGADVAFAGTIFPNRALVLKHLVYKKFNLKIWGPDVVRIPNTISPYYKKRLDNEYEHSKMVSATKIHIGMTRTPELSGSWSARLYRIMAAGGFYIQDHVPGLEDFFEIGKELEVFENKHDLSDKILYYLDHEKERKQIADRGMKKVREKHTFLKRMEELMKICGL